MLILNGSGKPENGTKELFGAERDKHDTHKTTALRIDFGTHDLPLLTGVNGSIMTAGYF